MASGLAQRPQTLGECHGIGSGGRSVEAVHDLRRIGAKRLDHVVQKIILAAELLQLRDYIRIDRGRRIGGKSRMRRDRRDPIG
jgi:hypothetical protein